MCWGVFARVGWAVEMSKRLLCGGGVAMTEPLRIDTPLVAAAGGRLEGLANAIPPPPAVFSPPGADPLSMAIAGKVAEVVSPAVAALPVTKEELTRYAQNVLNAAGAYDSTDRQLAEEILRRLGELDSASEWHGRCGDTGRRRCGRWRRAAGSPAAGAGQQAGQLGQMMGMPMQMAQQAAQIPMQMMGMAAAVPQGIMQGVQSAMQQVGQMSEMAGKDEQDAEGKEGEQPDPAAEKKPEEAAPRAERPPVTDPSPAQAAPGNTGGERVPEPDRPQAQPGTPAAPRPAPTRPAESAPEIAL